MVVASRVPRYRSTLTVLLASVVLAGCASPRDPVVAPESATGSVAGTAADSADVVDGVDSDRAEEVVGETATETTLVAEAPPPTATTSTAPPLVTSTSSPPVGTGLLEALTIASEDPRSGYDRSLFSHWRDIDGSGCDARQDTLARQAIGFPQVDLFDSCVIVEGDWYSIYDGVSYSGAPVEMQIDHVVALAEAWESGAWAWDEATRRAFANDRAHLVAVSSSSNASKAALDLAEWRPVRSAWCVTATITAQVKAAYGLHVDPAEYEAIAEMLGACGGSDQVSIGVVPVSSISVVTVAPTSASPPGSSTETSEAASAGSCVDVNTATLAELDTIIHIGPSRAAGIVSLRPFSSVEDLVRVSGIGVARLADIVEQGLACVG